MYKKIKRPVWAILGSLIALINILNPMTAAASDYYDDTQYHADIDYADMEIQWIDEDATMAFLDEYEDAIEAEDEEAIIAGYDKMIALMDYTDTQSQLNEIRYNTDVNNEEYSDLSDHMVDFCTDMDDRMLSLMRDALNSSCGAALKEHIGDEDLTDAILEYEDLTPEEKQLVTDYQELTQEYDRLYVADVHVDIDGKDWSFERLENHSDSVDYDEYYEIVTELYKKRNELMAPIYMKIVENRNRQAKIEGYDNYPEYAYENIYARDYTVEDIRKVYDGVSRYIVPLYEEMDADLTYNYKLEMMNLPGEERIARVAPVISRIHPDLQEAWDYLTEHKLYNIDPSPSKMETGYTVPLYSYGGAFIFDSPYENWHDIQTVIHEFGHYNETFHGYRHSIEYVHNVDVAEIHSQGLELLCLEYADEIYGESCADDVVDNVLTDMMDSAIDACIYDEFQYRAYTYDGELSTDILNGMFNEVSAKYGRESTPDMAEYYYWVMIPHTFESPMYYISYGTSALAAMDILAMSVEDRDAAIDCYMHLTTYHGDEGFREVLDDVGLPDIFEDGVIEDISIAVADYAGYGPESKKPEAIIKKLLADPVLVVSIIIILIVIIIIIVIRIATHSERKARNRMMKQQKMYYKQMRKQQKMYYKQMQMKR
ncbi:Oligoendopeptidase F [Lachnospiraceae bacterium XBB2008]|nr:Oligoendopeptidase F [Lachnospiraceae bacterium XBB2008]